MPIYKEYFLEFAEKAEKKILKKSMYQKININYHCILIFDEKLKLLLSSLVN